MNDNETKTTQQTTTPTSPTTNGEKLFTQQDLDRIIGERLSRLRDQLTDGNEYKAKYEAVKQELENMKAANLHRQKADVYRGLLEKANINPKRFPVVLRASGAEIDALELDEDGAAVGADKLIKDIQTEWADFVLITETYGAQISHPPYSPYYSGEGDKIADAFKPKI